jgi:hypothetical protein
MKYLVEVEYKKDPSDKLRWSDTLIVTSVKDFRQADYKIRQYLISRYSPPCVLTDIHINSFEYLEKVTVK